MADYPTMLNIQLRTFGRTGGKVEKSPAYLIVSYCH